MSTEPEPTKIEPETVLPLAVTAVTMIFSFFPKAGACTVKVVAPSADCLIVPLTDQDILEALTSMLKLLAVKVTVCPGAGLSIEALNSKLFVET